MQAEEAANIVNTVMAAWEWEMEPDTLDIWQHAIESLSDFTAAEQAVADLYMGRTRKQGRPMPGDVAEQYRAVVQRLKSDRAEQAVAALPEAEIPAHVPAHMRELVGNLRGQGLRGGDLFRAVLISKGIAAPIDTSHAEAHDPPLTVTEQRHSIHTFQGVAVESCRFCDSPPRSEHDATTREGGTA